MFLYARVWMHLPCKCACLLMDWEQDVVHTSQRSAEEGSSLEGHEPLNFSSRNISGKRTRRSSSHVLEMALVALTRWLHSVMSAAFFSMCVILLSITLYLSSFPLLSVSNSPSVSSPASLHPSFHCFLSPLGTVHKASTLTDLYKLAH